MAIILVEYLIIHLGDRANSNAKTAFIMPNRAKNTILLDYSCRNITTYYFSEETTSGLSSTEDVFFLSGASLRSVSDSVLFSVLVA